MEKTITFEQDEYGRNNSIRAVNTRIVKEESEMRPTEKPRRMDGETQKNLDELIEEYEEKSKFFLPEVKFLGYIVSTKGIRMDPEKIEAVMKFNAPRNRKDVQSFIGFLNFYRKYVKNFAKLIQPLTELLKN